MCFIKIYRKVLVQKGIKFKLENLKQKIEKEKEKEQKKNKKETAQLGRPSQPSRTSLAHPHPEPDPVHLTLTPLTDRWTPYPTCQELLLHHRAITAR